jgi:FkbM family methyltransferase
MTQNQFFLLTKPNQAPTDDNSDNQLVHLNNRQVFLLPASNLEYYIKNGLFECQMIEWCKQFCRNDRIFLDVGAHTGTYSIALADRSLEVYSFEPQRQTYYALCGSIALSNRRNINAFNFGLGSTEQVGPLPLHIISVDGGGSTVHSPTSGVLAVETIEIKTLDSLALSNIGFVKMDVEDNELFVLQGAVQTLERSGFPPIVFESNKENNPALFGFIQDSLKYRILKISGCINMYLATRD